jgi:Flp pilus assembly pilin Flp
MTTLRSVLARKIRSFLSAESGATSIEYAIMASGIALAVVASIALVSERVRDLYDSIVAALT